MNTLVSTLHDATHQVPGVPEHQDRPHGRGGAAHHGLSLQGRARKSLDATPRNAAQAHHHNPPRVLVRWQNRIAGLFGRRSE